MPGIGHVGFGIPHLFVYILWCELKPSWQQKLEMQKGKLVPACVKTLARSCKTEWTCMVGVRDRLESVWATTECTYYHESWMIGICCWKGVVQQKSCSGWLIFEVAIFPCTFLACVLRVWNPVSVDMGDIDDLADIGDIDGFDASHGIVGWALCNKGQQFPRG